MDLKEMYCERAEEIAEEVYGKEFTRLTPELQDKVWRMAETGVMEDCYDRADMMRKEF